MSALTYHVAVVGGGILGLATARACLQRVPGLRLLLLEKEPRLAAHQSGRNSGVVHSGIYYRPGSLKARLCVQGAQRLEAFCEAHGIPMRRCGKVIVAVEPDDVPALRALYERGLANGVPDLARIGPERLRELEPHVQGLEAIHLPHVAVVEFAAVAQAMARDVEAAGGEIRTNTRLVGLQQDGTGWRLGTTRGEFTARFLVNCAGLEVDRVGRMARDPAPLRIVPFRGEYVTLTAERASLVTGLVYPVPDPSLPFLGVHLAKTLTGDVLVGPNAVLALKREGYRRIDVSWRDCADLVGSRAWWRMAGRYWRLGAAEFARSLSPRGMLRAAQRLVPELRASDLRPGLSGVRAQAVGEDGALVDDFVLRESADALHVYNAPSPAATASLSISETIATRVSALRSSRPSLQHVSEAL